MMVSKWPDSFLLLESQFRTDSGVGTDALE